MAGRAGRLGALRSRGVSERQRENDDGEEQVGGARGPLATEEDAGGEAIVLCREFEEEKVRFVMSAGLPILESPLASESHGLQRLLLEALACGGESTRQLGDAEEKPTPKTDRGWFGGSCAELVEVASCTLLMIQRHRRSLDAMTLRAPSLRISAPLLSPCAALGLPPSPASSAPRDLCDSPSPRRAASSSSSSACLQSSLVEAPVRRPESRQAILQSPVYRDVKAAMRFLLERGLARFSAFRDAYEATAKGRAVAASQLGPQEGFLTCALLDRHVDELVLSNDLHLAYLAVPLPPLPPPRSRPSCSYASCPPSSCCSPLASPSPSFSLPSSPSGASGVARRLLCPRPTSRSVGCEGTAHGEASSSEKAERREQRKGDVDGRRFTQGERDLAETAQGDASALDSRRREEEQREQEVKTRFKREQEEQAFALTRKELQILQKILRVFSPSESFALAKLGLSQVDVEALDSPGFLRDFHFSPQKRPAPLASSDASCASSSVSSSSVSSSPPTSLSALQERRCFVVWRLRQALVLCLLLQGLEPKAVAAALAVSGGVSAVSLLHQQATLKAAMTAVLCARLGLWSLAEVLRSFQTRLEHSGLSLQVAPMLRLGVSSALARLLHDQLGVCTPQQLLAVGPARVAKALRRRLKLNVGRPSGSSRSVSAGSAATADAAKARGEAKGGREDRGIFDEREGTRTRENAERDQKSLGSSASGPSALSFLAFFHADRAAAEVTADLFAQARRAVLSEKPRSPQLVVGDRQAWLRCIDGLAASLAGRGEEEGRADDEVRGKDSKESEKSGARRKGAATESKWGATDGAEERDFFENDLRRGERKTPLSLASFLQNAKHVLDLALPHLLLKRRAPELLQEAEAELHALRKHEREGEEEGKDGDEESESDESHLLGLWGSKVLISAAGESTSDSEAATTRARRQLHSFDSWERRRTAWILKVARQLVEAGKRGTKLQETDESKAPNRRDAERRERRRRRRIGKAVVVAIEENWRRICAFALLPRDAHSV
uniref:DEAD/DEAH box helicase domain-containing protein n=1 Tax=Toxoplasma gondii TgCATBr9 TaxID=943120 RepID=A0A2T6IDR7_TOXGO|nr:DEAD/DEAH box helicase domain-containing protein [Toxoplasma gondii TgCATBr9]